MGGAKRKAAAAADKATAAAPTTDAVATPPEADAEGEVVTVDEQPTDAVATPPEADAEEGGDASPAADSDESDDAPGPLAPPAVDGAHDGAQGGPPPPAARRKPVFPYQMAPGKSVTSHHGPLADECEVKSEYFARDRSESAVGEETLRRLIDKGYIVDNTDSDA